MSEFIIYAIGAFVNFVFIMLLFTFDKESMNNSDVVSFAILTVLCWPIMDILIVGTYLSGHLIVYLEYLCDKISKLRRK